MNANLRNFIIWATSSLLILALFTVYHANLRNFPFWVIVVSLLVALFLVFLPKWTIDANLRKFGLWVISVLLLLALLSVSLSPGLFLNLDQRSVSQDISFSQLLNDVDLGKVREVIIQDQEIRGTFTDGRGFRTYAPTTPLWCSGFTAKALPS
jgi:hypothetical protein